MTGFKIYWDVGNGDGSFQLTSLVSDPSQLIFTTTAVSQGTSYAFKVSALNVHGESPLSEALTVTPAAPPTAPAILNLVSANVS